MSRTLSLSQNYSSFFWECTKFAVTPYTSTFNAVAAELELDFPADIIAAGLVVGILTFVVPVLPAFAMVTLALATVGVLLAAASMIATYPCALLMDIFDTEPTQPSGGTLNSCDL